MKRTSKIITASVIVGAAFAIGAGSAQVADKGASRSSANVDWPVYGGQPANQHYSSLTQINRNK
jgi:glucose dehydrogenase